LLTRTTSSALLGSLLIAIAACGRVEYRADLASTAPQERMLGISRSLEGLEPGDPIPAEVYRSLVAMLRSADGAERLYAIGTLEELTGTRRGFDTLASRSEREQAVRAWEAWLSSGSVD